MTAEIRFGRVTVTLDEFNQARPQPLVHQFPTAPFLQKVLSTKDPLWMRDEQTAYKTELVFTILNAFTSKYEFTIGDQNRWFTTQIDILPESDIGVLYYVLQTGPQVRTRGWTLGFGGKDGRLPPLTVEIQVKGGLFLECVLNRVGRSTTIESVCILNNRNTKSSTGSRSNLPQRMLSERTCPILRGYATTDVLFGANLSMAVLTEADRVYIKHPPLTKVVSGEECTLAGKVSTFRGSMDDFLEYSILRYFLWFLVRGVWTVQILRRSNTNKFFASVVDSPYACWIEYIRQPRLFQYNKYFVE